MILLIGGLRWDYGILFFSKITVLVAGDADESATRSIGTIPTE